MPPKAALPPDWMPSAMNQAVVNAHVGIGIKPQHFDAVLALADGIISGVSAPIEWIEVHPQNYFRAGGPMRQALRDLSAEWPVSFHSVGLSIGSHDGPISDELSSLAQLMADVAPCRLSDHLSWSGDANDRMPDLLPIPYCHAMLDHFASGVDRVQQTLGHRLLIENPSRMLAFADDDMDEGDFLNALVARTNCGILLDLNNVVVSANNIGFDAGEYLDRIDLSAVGELHLAGHAVEWHDDGPLLIDDHGSAVGDACWALFASVIARTGPLPTLIEWDTDVPSFDRLLAEASEAQRRLAAALSVTHRQEQVA